MNGLMEAVTEALNEAKREATVSQEASDAREATMKGTTSAAPHGDATGRAREVDATAENTLQRNAKAPTAETPETMEERRRRA